MDPLTWPVKLVQAFLRMVFGPFLDPRPGLVNRIRTEGRNAASWYVDPDTRYGAAGIPRWMEPGPRYPTSYDGPI